MRCQRVLGPVPAMTELADVQSVRLLVLVLEVPFEGIVTAEGSSAVGALLGLVDAPRRWRRHPYGSACNMMGTERTAGGPGLSQRHHAAAPHRKASTQRYNREVTECKRERGRARLRGMRTVGF